jgi:4-amino-4-deoxy-L-arabinose transferase-like glycosyltransferase
MALATLAKGPVAPALAALIIVVFAIRERDFRIVWRTLWIPGIVLFLAVALPWFVAVQLRIPGFFREFFLQHNLERFAVQNLYHRHQPFWYYVPVVLLAVMPWTVPFLAAFAAHLRDFRRRATAGEAHDPLPGFLVLWIVLVVGFFSLSQSKLPGYILPAIPPCTILAASWLQRRSGARLPWWMAVLHAAAVATLTVAAMVAPLFVVAKHAGLTVAVPPPLKMFAVLIGVLALLGVSLTILFRGTPMLRFATLAPLIFALAWLLRAGGPALDASLSSRPIAREVSQLAAGADRTVALFSPGHVTGESPLRELEYGLAFYLDRPIPEYDRGEVPAGDHLVIARRGSERALAEAVGGRRVSRLGDFPAQRLEFFWISPPTPAPVSPEDHQHHH